MAFASDDNLHETLWPAVSGKNVLIKAAALKADLARRIQLRNEGVQTFRHGYPIALPDSVITRAMDESFRPGWRQRLERDDRDDSRIKPGTLIEDLPPVDRDRIKEAFRIAQSMPSDEARSGLSNSGFTQ